MTRHHLDLENVPPSVKESIEHSKADYRQVGKSGLRVSVPILGAMSIGDRVWAPWVIGEDEVASLEGWNNNIRN